MNFKNLGSRMLRGRDGHAKDLRAIVVLWSSTMGGAVLAFGMQVVLARQLGVQEFGAFSGALAVVTLATSLAGFGITGYWLSVFGREGWGAIRCLPGSFQFLALTTTTVVAVLLGWAWFGPHDYLAAWLIAILTVHVLGQTVVELVSTKFQLEGRHATLAGWQITPHMLRLVAMVTLIYLLGQPHFASTHAAVVYALVSLCVFVAGARQLIAMTRGKLNLEWHREKPSSGDSGVSNPSLTKTLSEAWPFGLAGLFYLIYFQSDIILVKYLAGEASAGVYNVAFLVMSVLYLFPVVIYQKFLLPRLHRWVHYDKTKFVQAHRLGSWVMLVFGSLAMLLVWLLGPLIMPWVFGDEYHEAIVLTMILAFSAPVRFVSLSVGAMLMTGGYIRRKVRLMGFAAGFNIGANLMLIPFYGAIGAAIATVLTEVVLLCLYFYSARNVILRIASE